MSSYSARARCTPARRIRQSAVGRELRILADIHCQTRRALGHSVHYTALAVALHKAFGLEWGMALEFARAHVDAWLLREDSQRHPSMRGRV